MPEAAERLFAMRRQLVSRVRDALDDAAPDIAESAVGRMTQAGALVQLAAELLSEQVGPVLASQMVSELVQRTQRAL
jgi:hypothetical protein